MAPPSTQGVKRPQARETLFPRGVTTLDQDTLTEVASRLLEEFLPNVEEIAFGREEATEFISRYVANKNAHIATAARFHEARIPLPGTVPDLTIQEGAGVKAWASLDDKLVTITHPILMGGWTALGGTVGIERIVIEDGAAKALPCCIPIPIDITDQVLASRAGGLFPESRIEAIPLQHVLEFDPPPPSDDRPNLAKIILGALHEAALKIEFYENAGPPIDLGEQTPLASIQAFINFPQLLQTFSSERYRHFDFTGLLAGSAVDWKRFPLDLLPKPEGISFREDSTGDLSIKYDPDEKRTDIYFHNIDAAVFVDSIFGTEPMLLSGDISVSIWDGGYTWIEFDKLNLEFPVFPHKDVTIAAISGRLDGAAALALNEEGTLFAEELAFDVSEVAIRTPTDRGVGLVGTDAAFSGELYGNLSVRYDSNDLEQPMEIEWSALGEMAIASGQSIYFIEKVSTDGILAGDTVHGWLSPQIDRSFVRLTADSVVTSDDGLTLSQPLIIANGKTARQAGGTLIRSAHLLATSENLHALNFDVRPRLELDLLQEEGPDGSSLSGTGRVGASAWAMPLDVGAAIQFGVDDRGSRWELRLDQDQVIGPVTASGEMTASQDPTGELTITTDTPFDIFRGSRKIGRGITINGRGDEQMTRVRVAARALPGGLHGSLVARKNADSDRIFGGFRIGKRHTRLAKGTRLQNLNVSGRYATSPLATLRTRPRVGISNGQLDGQVVGDVNGPIHADFSGQLGLGRSGRIYYSFNRKKPATIAIGPLGSPDSPLSLEGHAELGGTVGVRIADGRPSVSGRHLGIEKGQAFLANDGKVLQKNGQDVPLIDNFRVHVDSFTGIRRDVLRAGGDGIQFSTDINLDAASTALSTDLDVSQIHISKPMMRIPVSIDGLWKLFRRHLRDWQSSVSQEARP